MAGSQDFAPDPRNETVLVYVNGSLTPRGEAKVSVFDAGFSMGDGVWEGIRLHKGALVFLAEHLHRLRSGASAIGLRDLPDDGALTEALWATLRANAMTDGVHVRLMVTRGVKSTVSQDPRNALGPPTIVITAEHKRATPPGAGLRLHTSKARCSDAATFDMRLNSHSRLNLIIALLEAVAAGADEALMLDPRGFVSSCNATNFFFFADGEVRTSSGAYCFNGVTRGAVIGLCREAGVPLAMGDYTPEDLAQAEEAFVTGTMAGVTPVAAIDGRSMPATPGPITMRLGGLYAKLLDTQAEAAERARSRRP
jgi:branched-chain amino acid aminotransferase